MSRLTPRLSYRFPLLALAGFALLAGCAEDAPPPNVLRQPPPGAPSAAAAPGAPVRAQLPGQAATAAAGRPIGETPLGEGRLSDPRALDVACREYADQVIAQHDRSELMREDERDSRLGSFSGASTFRAPTDRMGRRFERDNIARDCVARNARGTPER